MLGDVVEDMKDTSRLSFIDALLLCQIPVATVTTSD